ncbi:unnamed protein product [Trichobilharzia szidati]|nr:unnamed protein product [Trichobilharzia szidati]
MLTDEEIKQKQARIKENRELRRALIDERHMYLVAILERYFGSDANTICDWLLDTNQLEAMQDFFAKGKNKALFVIQTDLGYMNPRSKDTFRILKKPSKGVKRLYFHSGTFTFSSDTVVFLRYDNKYEITMKNIANDVFTMKYDVREGFLTPFKDCVESLFYPALSVQDSYLGNLSKEEQYAYNDFVNAYVRSLTTIIACSKEQVVLAPSKLPDNLQNADADYLIQMSTHPDVLNHLEENASYWMKQIEKEVKEVELLRVEREHNGPHGEFDFWKCRMTRMNSLVSQLRRTDISNVLAALKHARSKALDDLMKKKMPNLLKALALIYQHSTFYNTFSHMTILFVKISNQIISTFKSYLTMHHTKSIWDQDSKVIVSKMEKCIELNLSYQEAYKRTSQEMNDANANRMFNFSEVQIFGNINLFTQRLGYLIRVIKTLEEYSALRDFVLEGKDVIISKLDRIHSNIISKNYNYLDQRNQQFESDYEDFKNKISDLHVQLLSTINAYFKKPVDLLARIKLQERLETLDIAELEHAERYKSICLSLKNEISNISRLFKSGLNDPSLERNMPPFAGRIIWARSFYYRLEEPMNTICKRAPKVLLTESGQELVRAYNEVTSTLVSYEITVYQTWVKLLTKKMTGLMSSVIVFSREPEPFGRPYVNLDPDIVGVLHEIQCLDEFQCPIVKMAEEFWYKSAKLKQNCEMLKLMCNEYARITKMIPQNVEQLLLPTIQIILKTIEPGIALHNWTSVNLKAYTESVFKELYRLERILIQSNEILEYRIMRVIKRIAQFEMITLPDDPNSPLEMMELVRQTKQQCKKAAEEIDSLSLSVMQSATDYIDALLVDFEAYITRNNMRTQVLEELRIKHLLTEGTQEQGGKLETRKPVISISEDEEKSKKEKEVADEDTSILPQGEKFPGPQETMSQQEQQTTSTTVRLSPIKQASLRLAVQIAYAADEVKTQLGQQTTDAVCQAVRSALDKLWNIMATREASMALKDVPVGKTVKFTAEKPIPLVRCYIRIIGHTLDVSPRPHDIQAALKAMVNTAETCTKGIISWGKEGYYGISKRRSSLTIEDTEAAHAKVLKPKVNKTQRSGSQSQSVGSRQEQLRIPLSPAQDTDAGSSGGSQASAVQRKSDTGVFQTASEEEAAVPTQRISIGAASVGQPGAQLLASSGAMGTSGSLCGSSGTTTSMEGETTKKTGKMSIVYDIRGLMPSDLHERTNNCYRDVHTDREVYRLRTFLLSSMLQMKKILFCPDVAHFFTIVSFSYLQIIKKD